MGWAGMQARTRMRQGAGWPRYHAHTLDKLDVPHMEKKPVRTKMASIQMNYETSSSNGIPESDVKKGTQYPDLVLPKSFGNTADYA